MESLNFNNTSFVLYQILPDYKKIDFISRLLNNESSADVFKSMYEEHFKGVIAPVGKTEIGILSYINPDGDKVNIFFHEDYLHVNSNKLRPIYDLVAASFIEGHIIVLDKEKKKTKENKHRYHLRYYRAYRRINHIDKNMPLCFS